MNKKFIGGLIMVAILVAVGSLIYFSNQKNNPLINQEQAIDAVIKLRPELASYKTTSLPPSSIEAKQTASGWYVGFIQSGSGINRILNAKCYRVTNAKDIKEVVLVGTYQGQSDKTAQSIELETCEPVFAGQLTTSYLAYGDVKLKLNQIVRFKNISLRPLSIEEDSRCPSDVQCIQAGTVRVKAEIVSGMGTSTSILKLGQEFTTKSEAITLKSVTPDKNSKVEIKSTDYIFVFNVMPRVSVKNPEPEGKCYVGGCSSQLCSDKPDAVSTCEYREEYACYKTATCKRQSSGECGWTKTAALSACLINSKSEAI